MEWLRSELSAAGKEVIVVEKGAYYADHHFTGRELASQSLFEKNGLFTTSDLSMSILAGSTLGGGTTINWAASLRTPEDVLYEWEHDYGFTGASGVDFQHSLDAVLQRMNVGVEETPINGNNAPWNADAKPSVMIWPLSPATSKAAKNAASATSAAPLEPSRVHSKPTYRMPTNAAHASS